MRNLFLRSIFQNIAVLTPVVKSLTHNWVKMAHTCISSTKSDREMKINSNGNSEVRCSFLKTLSLSFKVLIPHSDVINPKMGQKGPNWSFVSQC